MRFERITIERFGGLTEFDTGEVPLPRLVVVQGPNEAGKSSLFNFLTALLYGFLPASRDRNPYSPWGGGEIDGQARLRLDDGRLQRVHRRLLASPWGQLSENGRVEEIRNRPLECASGVPREVFTRIFALTLADLAGLEGESWEAVQDRLIGLMGAADIVPPREAAAQLEEEANALWRPDRRGKPRAGILRGRVSELRKRRNAAREADGVVRGKAAELVRVREALHGARREREKARHLREKIEKLAPVRRQLLRISELRAKAGSTAELEGLPPDPAGRLEELDAEREKVEARLRRLEEEEAGPRARAAAGTGDVSRMVEQGGPIRALAARMGEVLHAVTRRNELDAEIRQADIACEEEARELFTAPWESLARSSVEDTVSALPPGALRSALREVREAAAETRSYAHAAGTARAEEGTEARPSRRHAWGGAALVALGIILVLVGRGVSVLQPVGIVVLFTGGMLLAGWWGARGAAAALRAREAGERERVEARRREAAALHREATAREATARARLDALLEGLPLRQAHREDPGPELAEGMLRLQGHLRERKSREGSRAALARVLKEVGRDLSVVRIRLGAGGNTADPADPIHPADATDRAGGANFADAALDPAREIPRLEGALRDAESVTAAAAQAERELSRLAREREETETELARIRGERVALAGRLDALGASDEYAGLRRAVERMDAKAHAESLAAELDRAHPDLDELRARIDGAEASGGGWIFDDAKRAEATARERELSQEVEALGARAEGLERDIGHMRGRETLDEVDGAILEAQEEIDRLVRERDRRFVLAHLLRKADGMFREAHQPDIIQRAAGYMGTITGGRYDGLSVGEDERTRIFYLRESAGARLLPVGEPISTGTREQVYLALRLAIVDHLDSANERLPLFIDEAFVNWDRERRGLGFDLLEKLSAERQIFVFTCHESMAGELAARGAHTITLGSREAG